MRMESTFDLMPQGYSFYYESFPDIFERFYLCLVETERRELPESTVTMTLLLMLKGGSLGFQRLNTKHSQQKEYNVKMVFLLKYSLC